MSISMTDPDMARLAAITRRFPARLVEAKRRLALEQQQRADRNAAYWRAHDMQHQPRSLQRLLALAK